MFVYIYTYVCISVVANNVCALFLRIPTQTIPTQYLIDYLHVMMIKLRTQLAKSSLLQAH